MLRKLFLLPITTDGRKSSMKMKTIIKVIAIALLWLAVTFSGRLGTVDTILRLQMAHAWWTGTEEVSPDYQPKERGDLQAGVKGVGGKRYLAYDPGQSLLMLPGDWLGTKLHPYFSKVGANDFRQLVVVLTFIPLNVAAVVSCFWLLRLLDFEERLAGIASIIWLISTTVLHYAQVPFQNNQILLFVAIGYASALAYVRRGNPGLALLSGLSLAAALLIRMTSVFHAITVLLFLVGCIAYQSRNLSKVAKAVGLWIVGFIPLALLGRVFDYIRYGSFWTTGAMMSVKQINTDPIWSSLPERDVNNPFSNDSYIGIWGVLFSPAKSIFIYDPLLLPCLVLGIIFWKKLSPYIQWYLVTGILNLGLHIALTSRLVFWHGDSAWAARYHVTSVQLLLIPLVALFMQYLLSAKRLTAWLMRGVLALAIAVQIASVIMLFSLEDAQSRLVPPDERFVQFRLGQRITNIVCAIDSSFSEQCPSRVAKKLSPDKKRFLEYHNQVALLPFNYVRFGLNRKWTFLTWGLALTLALVGTTFWLIRLPRKNR
jgi:hypothetical protein